MTNPGSHTSETYIKNYSLLPEKKKKQQREDAIPLTNWKKKFTRPIRLLVFVVENFIGRVITHFAKKKKKKKCLNCEKVRRTSSHCKSQNNKNWIRQAISNQKYENNIRKYVLVKMLNKEVKLQLDSGSDLTIINLHTLRKSDKPTMQKKKRLKLLRQLPGRKSNSRES